MSKSLSPPSLSPPSTRSPPTSTPTAAASPNTNSCLHNQHSHQPGHGRTHVPPDPLQRVHNSPSPCLNHDVTDLPRLEVPPLSNNLEEAPAARLSNNLEEATGTRAHSGP